MDLSTRSGRREYYNQWLSYESDLASRGWMVPRFLIESLVPYLSSNETILDVGCGSGLIGKELSRLDWKGILVGIDIAEKMLKKAKQKIKYNFCIQADAYSLPFSDVSFDVVLSSGMIGLTDHRSVYEMYRLVKPGGYLACVAGEVKDLAWSCDQFQEACLCLKKLPSAQTVLSQDLGSGYTTNYDNEHYSYFLYRKIF